jgi:hypothetical protein
MLSHERSKMMKRTIFATIAILFSGAILCATELSRVEEHKARSLFAEYLKKVDKSPNKYSFSLKPFGKSTWIIDCLNTAEDPSRPWRHIMNSRGEVTELTIDSMNVVFLNEYSVLPEESDRKKLIDDFTTQHSGDPVNIIAKTSDIPGYDKAPLDADIADAVRAPFSFGKLTTVVYTYRQVGGIVSRYRFQFNNGTSFKKAECVVVGKGIGDAQYYE